MRTMRLLCILRKQHWDGFERVKADEGRYDVIVCSGGDGTLNEIVSAVAGYSTVKPPIGYIPSGSTNDFARSLGIPSDKIRLLAI